MKSVSFKGVLSIPLLVSSLIFILVGVLPTVAYCQTPFSINKEISINQENWFDNLDQPVNEFTPVFYRVTGTNNLTSTLTLDLFDSFFAAGGGSITQTFTMGLPGNGTNFRIYGPAITYTFGLNTNMITATAANINFFATDSASFTRISSAVPEPITLLLVGSGLLGIAGLRKRLRK